jgi:hypothetical protein
MAEFQKIVLLNEFKAEATPTSPLSIPSLTPTPPHPPTPPPPPPKKKKKIKIKKNTPETDKFGGRKSLRFLVISLSNFCFFIFFYFGQFLPTK